MISLTGIAALEGITLDNNGAKIGAGTKLSAIASHADLKRLFPSLTEAADQWADRRFATWGSWAATCVSATAAGISATNMSIACSRGPGCFALDGENKYHALFAQGHRCVIVHPSTLAPALIALGATPEIQGPKGRSNVELAKFFRAPTGPAEREHNLAPNEVVVSVTIPTRPQTNASYEVRHSSLTTGPW